MISDAVRRGQEGDRLGDIDCSLRSLQRRDRLVRREERVSSSDQGPGDVGVRVHRLQVPAPLGEDPSLDADQTAPGQTALTRMVGATSRARPLCSATGGLARRVRPDGGSRRRRAEMIRSSRWRRRPGAACGVSPPRTRGPSRARSPRSSAPSPPTSPARLAVLGEHDARASHTMSTRPWRAAAASTAASTSVDNVTSSLLAWTRSEPTSACSDARPGSSMSVASTTAPCSTKHATIARPIPEPPPVTNATWPVRSADHPGV